MSRKERTSYKDKFVRYYINASVDPGTIRRWKRKGLEGQCADDTCNQNTLFSEIDVNENLNIVNENQNLENDGMEIESNFDQYDDTVSSDYGFNIGVIPDIDNSGQMDADCLNDFLNNVYQDDVESEINDSSDYDNIYNQNFIVNDNADDTEFNEMNDSYSDTVYSDDDEENDNDEREINLGDFQKHDICSEWNTVCEEIDVSILEKWIMFQQSNISVWEVLNMVTALTIRHNLADEAQQSILNLIKILAGDEFEVLNTSKYIMNKLFNPPKNSMAYVFYCEMCNIPLNTPIEKSDFVPKSVECEKCKEEYLLSIAQKNWFTVLNLKYQIESLLKISQVRQQILDSQNVIENDNNNCVNDVINSGRYLNDDYIKEKKNNGDVVLTLNVNTDGTPQFESGNQSFWPIQCTINEISKQIRNRYILLGSLWYTATEPSPQFMNMYLGVFLSQIKYLMEIGIVFDNTRYFVKIFSIPVDSVARPIMQNRHQFNGLYGCSWCYVKGVYNSGCMRFLQAAKIPKVRSNLSYIEDVKKRQNDVSKMRKTKKNLKYTVNGVKGPSVLLLLDDFDCIWGFPFEYMHGALLGVAKQFWDEINTNHLTASQRKLVNKRLIAIRPPSEIHRTPRILKSKNKWKATEWRSWLLFYSIPCLTEILDKKLLNSYKLIVKSIYKLLLTRITEDDLLECELDILQFVHDSQIFYGEKFMTFNMHILLHMVQSVRHNGPLWATSAFPYESNIYHLKQNVSGPKGVINQIAKRTLRCNNFKNYLTTTENKTSWNFCKNIFNTRKEVNGNFFKSVEGAILIEDKGNSNIQLYNRCIFNGTKLHSELYTKTKKCDNSFILLSDNSFGQILYFFVSNNKAYIQVKKFKINVCENLNHIWKGEEYENSISVSLSIMAIVCKLIFIEIDNIKYFCMQPNSIEIQ